MNDLSVMRGQLLKRVLPFMLALLVGVAAFFVVRRERARHAVRAHAAAEVAGATRAKTEPRELPEVHVLSPMLMSEVLEFERVGGGYEAARVISPNVSQYTAAKVKDYRQGVLQLEFLFGADGTISEVKPPAKRHDCGLCLSGANVTQIDPRDPRWSEQVAAAKEAVSRIEFVPGTNGGRAVGMHGVAECVFRLE
jgi:hypothetical protein